MKSMVYYQIKFILASPLVVGSGENTVTDKDIVVNGKGIPYIPGTSLAGVNRSIMSRFYGAEEIDEYFGEKMIIGKEKIKESKIIVYDAQPEDVSEFQSLVFKRDMVALDQYKTAKAGAKFDFQVLEPGYSFVACLEASVRQNKDIEFIERLVGEWENNAITIGAKTTRGFGQIKTTEIKKAQFDLTDSVQLEAWLNFSPFMNQEWKEWHAKNSEMSKDNAIVNIRLSLKQKGGISIREYSTNVGEADYRQLTLHNGTNTAVIPGTSWSGAIRAQMVKLGMKENELKTYFGYVDASNTRKSRIRFSESQILGGEDILYTRNAIDRFTAGTVNGALYKEKTHYNGETVLTIQVDLSQLRTQELRKQNKRFFCVLAAAIMDLHYGVLAVGGLTAVGRGIFEIADASVNGNRIENIDYKKIVNSLMAAYGEEG